MNTAYSQFKESKKKDKEEMIHARSTETLSYYERIGKLLDDESYEYCHEFLESIASFIEKNEYLTDRQIEAVNNIESSHKDFTHSWNNKEPF